MQIVKRLTDWLRKDAPPVALSLRSPDGWPVERVWSGETISPEGALSLSAVFGCVNLLAGTISSLPVMVYQRRRDGQREDATGHPLYRLLHDSPNRDQTAVDFWEFMQGSLELWGNAYARIERVGGRIVALYPIAPANVAVRRLPDGRIEYAWTEEGHSHRETDEGVFHVRGFGGGPLRGLSTLAVGRQVLGGAMAAERSAGEMFRNGLRPSGVLTFENWLKPEQRDVAETKLVEKFAGAQNTGRPMVLEGGAKWEALTINPEDAQMLETRRFGVEEVCRLFGVPPHMIGHTENSTSWGTGLEQQTLAFQKFTLRRRIKRLEQAVEKQLLTPADRGAGVSVEFNLEGLLRADSAARASFYQTMTMIGAMTINEVRALESLPPVAGGETPRMQMQNVPITMEAGNADQAE